MSDKTFSACPNYPCTNTTINDPIYKCDSCGHNFCPICKKSNCKNCGVSIYKGGIFKNDNYTKIGRIERER